MSSLVEEVDSPWYGRIRILVGDEEMSAAIRAGALWERRLVEVYTAHVRAGSTAVDVGANIGCHTIILASLVGPRGRVLAYEPQPLLAGLLRANTAGAAAGIEVRQAAVGESAGTARVSLPDYETSGNPGGWSLAVGSGKEVKRRIVLGDEPEDVDVVRLDDEDAVSSDGAVDLIKIDVEGMELDVLQGGARLLAAHQPAIFLETRDHRHEIDEFLASIGYCRLEAVGTPAGADFASVPESRREVLRASLEPRRT